MRHKSAKTLPRELTSKQLRPRPPVLSTKLNWPRRESPPPLARSFPHLISKPPNFRPPRFRSLRLGSSLKGTLIRILKRVSTGIRPPPSFVRTSPNLLLPPILGPSKLPKHNQQNLDPYPRFHCRSLTSTLQRWSQWHRKINRRSRPSRLQCLRLRQQTRRQPRVVQTLHRPLHRTSAPALMTAMAGAARKHPGSSRAPRGSPRQIPGSRRLNWPAAKLRPPLWLLQPQVLLQWVTPKTPAVHRQPGPTKANSHLRQGRNLMHPAPTASLQLLAGSLRTEHPIHTAHPTNKERPATAAGYSQQAPGFHLFRATPAGLRAQTTADPAGLRGRKDRRGRVMADRRGLMADPAGLRGREDPRAATRRSFSLSLLLLWWALG